MTESATGEQPYAVKYDLTNCESEPIHIIRLVQPHACLVACSLPDFKIVQISDNSAAIIGQAPEKLLGTSIKNFLDTITVSLIKEGVENPDGFNTINPIRVHFATKTENAFMNLVGHINPDGLVILEIEPISNNLSTSVYQYQISKSIQRVQESGIEDLFQVVAEEIKKVTDYDRVMIYKFDEHYNGEVIAEVTEPHLEPFLHIKYPASDIPKQARALFLKNKVRIIVDVHGKNSRVIPITHPETNQPLDLTYGATRGVSPIHIEYLINMGVKASMNVVITIDNKLWGLIACHHGRPKYLDHTIRSTCGFIGQIFSGHLALQAANDYRQSVIKTNIIRNSLFEQMGKDFNVIEGLTEQPQTVLNLLDCSGVAVVADNQIRTLGKTPTNGQILDLADWLADLPEQAVFETNELPNLYPPALLYKEVAAGIMSIKFAIQPNEFVIWFRPEQAKEVFWGGNPTKAVVKTEQGTRVSPRKSFAKWKEIVSNTARPWQRFEKDAAIALRNDIKEYIILKFHEIRKLNQETMKAYDDLESFSYSVSHDLRAPLRTIEGYTQILKEDYVEQIDKYGVEVLNTIIESVQKMNQFINDILNFSKLGKTELILNELDTEQLIRSIYEDLVVFEEKDRKIELKINKKLPTVWGDESLLTQLFTNLISNAIKYTRNRKKAIIEIAGEESKGFSIIKVKDNGIGFDMQYLNKIFGVFTRLVGEDEFEGTGVGLAIVKRVIDRHDGEITVESKEDIGTSFTIKLPNKRFLNNNQLKK